MMERDGKIRIVEKQVGFVLEQFDAPSGKWLPIPTVKKPKGEKARA